MIAQTKATALPPEEARLRAIGILDRLGPNPPTLVPYLPLLFQLHGKPYSLRDHFPFEPLFRTRLPRSQILKTGRQVAKSTYLSTSSTIFAVKNPHSIQLFLTPLFEQIRRFSVNYMQPLLSESPVRQYMIDSTCNQSVLQRTFTNKALMHFSYAYLSSNRIRGIGGVWRIGIDEFQDMASDHLPVVLETMAAAPAPWGLIEKTGTPKALDNPIEAEWRSSSMGTWEIPCPHCKKENLCSTDYDLLKMIGPWHEDICEACPGTVCAGCKKPINPRTGRWRHMNPELRWTERGFHIPQVIMPMHYANPEKWRIVTAKMAGKFNYTTAQFHNEVLGESYDQGSKLLTLADLKRACSLEIINNPTEIPVQILAKRRLNYEMVILGIDWGGGGGEQMSGASEKARRQRTSFTTISLMGMRKDRKIEVLWGTRLRTPNDHDLEAKQIMAMIRNLRPDMIAHDMTGAGALRETLLVTAGVPRQMFAGFDYKSMPTGVMVKSIPSEVANTRGHFRIDKTRSINTTLQAIRQQDVVFFQYDNRGKEDPGILSDLLALTEEKVEGAVGERYLIRRILSMPDDFAHSVNLGAHLMWLLTRSTPSYWKNQHSSTQGEDGEFTWADDHTLFNLNPNAPPKPIAIPGFSVV